MKRLLYLSQACWLLASMKPNRHAGFVEKYHVAFRHVSDSDPSVATEHRVLTRKTHVWHARDETFLNDPQWMGAKRCKELDPKVNPRQAPADCVALKRVQHRHACAAPAI